MNLVTQRLELSLETPELVRERIDNMSAEDKQHLSANWLALVEQEDSPSPWVHGFSIAKRDENKPIGQCGFKAPPSPDGVVEIAYGIDEAYQGQGFATEAAAALVEFAFEQTEVSRVHAHTLLESNASTRVLTKCGFENLGQAIDPEDGPVWRWEIQRSSDQEPPKSQASSCT